MLSFLRTLLSAKNFRCSARQAFVSVLVSVLLLLFLSVISLQKQNGGSVPLAAVHPDETRRSWDHVARQPQNASWRKSATWCNIGGIMSHFARSPSLPSLQHNLNNCTRVFYNRVPKCASRTILAAFQVVSKKVNTNYIAAERGMPTNYFKKVADLAAFPEQFMNYDAPLLYSRHLHFVNFSQFGFPLPIYINVIRDPTERIISHYYFHQFGSFSQYTNNTIQNEATDHSKEQQFLNGTNPITPVLKVQAISVSNSLVPSCLETARLKLLDECVQSKTSTCLRPYLNKVLPFFCGHSKACIQGGSVAHLRWAKRVVRDHYLVVGLTEDLPAFMEVLQNLMPRMFANVTQAFQTIENHAQQKFKTVNKPEVSQRSRQIIKEVLAKEYDFYHFVKQRFYNLLERVRKARTFEQEGDTWIT